MINRFSFILVCLFLSACSALSIQKQEIGQPYPDLSLYDESGAEVHLSTLKGKVLLIEPIAMGCSACQAFSGAHEYGAYGTVLPQPGLQCVQRLLGQYAGGVSLKDENVQFIQIVFLNFSLQSPTPQELSRWAKHFHLPQQRVLVLGAPSSLSTWGKTLIPGFQLIDKDFILRADSTGAVPKTNLYDELLPLLPVLAH